MCGVLHADSERWKCSCHLLRPSDSETDMVKKQGGLKSWFSYYLPRLVIQVEMEKNLATGVYPLTVKGVGCTPGTLESTESML